MKALKKYLPAMLLLIIFCGEILFVTAQKPITPKQVEIKNLIDDQPYVFYAQSVTPTSGRQRFLTTDYTVSVSKDTIVSDLPFFGRAYSPPVNPSEGGIKFTSIDFDYKLSPGKKSGWNITIQPKDITDIQQLIMKIFENGTASLQVTSINRQPISFNGYIKGKK